MVKSEPTSEKSCNGQSPAAAVTLVENIMFYYIHYRNTGIIINELVLRVIEVNLYGIIRVIVII